MVKSRMKSEATVETWSRWWGGHWNFGVTPTRLNIFKLFKEIGLSNEDKILDIGCGSGTLAHYWHKKGHDIRAIDFNDDALALTSKKGIRCTKADITQGLPFDNNSFGLVYSDGLLEHFPNPYHILDEIWRISKRYILTLLPRDCLYHTMCSLVFNFPKEYLKTDEEWIALHLSFKPKRIEVKKVRSGILWILCEKE